MPIHESTLTPVPLIMQAELESHERDPLHAFTGMVWGSLMGGACWLTVLALLLTG